jgi:hypothetical protein
MYDKSKYINIRPTKKEWDENIEIWTCPLIFNMIGMQRHAQP